MPKHATPLLDQLESGPWPSFVSDIKQEAAARAANPKGLDYQIPADAPEDLLGVLELSYEEKETHWKHGGIVGVFGYGGGVIGRYCDQPEKFPGVAHFHTMRVAQPAAKYYNTKFLRDLCDIWDLRGSGITNKLSFHVQIDLFRLIIFYISIYYLKSFIQRSPGKVPCIPLFSGYYSGYPYKFEY